MDSFRLYGIVVVTVTTEPSANVPANEKLLRIVLLPTRPHATVAW